jgi:molybdopterin synthase sulfur carrier subunit
MNTHRLKVMYFARLREELGRGSEEIDLDPGVTSVGALASKLVSRGGAWRALALNSNVRVAVNQEMADASTGLKAGDEVAFFPPVTGG